jgi:hypothetical protein
MKKSLFQILASILTATFVSLSCANALVVVYSDFSTFSDGNLVGQGGWLQFGTNSSTPIQVVNGRVVWDSGINIGSGQDAILPFGVGNEIFPPASGTASVFMAFRMEITGVIAGNSNPSYFAALSIDSSTSSAPPNFVNARLAARESITGMELGARVTGQAGFPYFYGQPLSLNTTLTVVARVNLAEGAQNDTVDLFINPTSADFELITPYTTALFTSGVGTDPTSLGGLVLSQFTNATTAQAGVSIERLLVTTDPNLAWQVIPEPNTAILLFGVGGLILIRRMMKPSGQESGSV